MKKPDEFNVVIVGGGLVGALSAVYMAKRGYSVSVYEKRGDIRLEKQTSGRSINLALSTRGISALQGCGLGKVIETQLIPMEGRMIHYLDGKQAPQLYGVFGECINSIDRKWINQTLLTEADSFENVSLHFNQSLETCDFEKKELAFKTYLFTDKRRWQGQDFEKR